MSPLPVIEELDGLRDLAPRLLPGFVATLLRQLTLQRAPETLHRPLSSQLPFRLMKGIMPNCLRVD